jgi:hypothetical protein
MIFSKRMARLNVCVACATIGLAVHASVAFADDGYFQWQANALSGGFTPSGRIDYLYGNGTPSGNVFAGQFEHFDENRFGSNWIDFEDYHGADMSGDPSKHDNYILFVNPRLSIGKMLGKDLSYGVFKDLSIAARYEKSNYGDFWVKSYGLLANFNFPGFSYFETDAYAREASYVGAENTSPNLFYRIFFKLNQFTIAGIKINQMTTLIVNFRKDSFGTEFVARPDFFTPIDDKGRFEVGLRFDIHSYNLPGSLGGGRSTIVRPMLMFRAYL